MAALRDNLMSRFDCQTMKMCRKFRLILDPMPYFYPNNDFSNGEDPLHDIDSFSQFVQDMHLFISKSKDYLQTLLFQLREVRKIMFKLISSLRNNGLREQINSSMFLKQVFELLEDDSMSEARYLMSCIVTFPVFEAIVDS